ncbi:MAG: helix-turn-helix domain-containing protein [Cyanosarcina radialis HA8281-LM2]|jgi:transposase|nr:helix-turn-helix domain-containing protein [Cyanosarcina radialis HA8281-LM2]
MSRKAISLPLTGEQTEELESVRDRDARPYVRERAAALLKVAAGQSGLQVATRGLLKPRDPDTIYQWVKRYESEGVKGLIMRTGRGRKPAFFP